MPKIEERRRGHVLAHRLRMATPQYPYLILDPDILAAVVRTRIEYRCNKNRKRRMNVEALRRDNPFLVPTPPELAPWWKKAPRVRAKKADRPTTMAAALVWAMLIGFVAVAYACQTS
jgi:hypothetical protein